MARVGGEGVRERTAGKEQLAGPGEGGRGSGLVEGGTEAWWPGWVVRV
jgi:hypothetical protein